MTLGFVLSRLVMVFTAMAAGYILVKTKLLDASAGTVLSRLIVYVLDPALVLNSALTSDRVFTNEQIFLFTGIALACYAFLIATSYAVVRLLRVKDAEKGLYQFMYIFSNIGFFGIPVISSLYGPNATILITIFIIPFEVLSFTYGITRVSGGKYKFHPKMLLHPMIIASVAAYALYLLRVTPPAVVTDTIEFIGRATSPCAMLVVGILIANAPLKRVFANPRMYGLIVIKMILVPALVLFVLRRLIPPGENVDLLIAVAVMVMAMPTATNTALLATQYGGDAEGAACGVFLATVSTVVTIPLLVWLIQVV